MANVVVVIGAGQIGQALRAVSESGSTSSSPTDRHEQLALTVAKLLAEGGAVETGLQRSA